MPAEENQPRDDDAPLADEAQGDGPRRDGAREESACEEPGLSPRLVRTAEERPALLRRQVRLGRFLGMGLIAAILAAMALTFFTPENPDFVPADPTLQFSRGQVFGFLLVYLSPIGLGLGGLVGLLVGRFAGRAERVTVTRHSVRAAESGEEGEEAGSGEAAGTREA